MTNTRLILIEGIPGSGKTTTAQFVFNWLEKQGRQTSLFLEGDLDHPADYESTACLNHCENDRLINSFPMHADFLSAHGYTENGDWYYRYRKQALEHAGDLPDDLLDALSKFDVYSLPAERFKRIILQSWEKFAQRAAKEKRTYVFECCFLQNPITTLLAYHNQTEADVRDFMDELCKVIESLQPKLVYLVQTNEQKTLQNVRLNRPVEWMEFVTRYLTGQEYGKTHGLLGYEGVIEFYRRRQALELDLLNHLPFSSIVISDQDQWDTRYLMLTAYLQNQS